MTVGDDSASRKAINSPASTSLNVAISPSSEPRCCREHALDTGQPLRRTAASQLEQVEILPDLSPKLALLGRSYCGVETACETWLPLQSRLGTNCSRICCSRQRTEWRESDSSRQGVTGPAKIVLRCRRAWLC